MRQWLLASTILTGSALLAAPAAALVVTKTNSAPALLEASSTTRDVSLAAADFVGSTGIITAVTIEIDFSKCSFSGGGGTTDGCLTYSSSSGQSGHDQIVLTLTAPSGTEVALVSQGTFGGFYSDRRTPILFDDAGAALPFEPAAGTFAPVGSLADFIGESALGDWSLFVEDTELNRDDPLVFHSFTLDITVEDESLASVPEPAAGAMLLAGLGALWLRRRRP